MTSPVLAVEMPDGSRMYEHPVTKARVPSVTTVIGVIAKPALVGWSAKMAAQYAVSHWGRLSEVPALKRVEEIRYAHQRLADDAAETGDAVHEVIDAYAKGIAYPDLPEGVSGYVNSFISFMTGMQPRFICNEFTVWSHAHGYAGTGDFIAEIDGKTTLVDIKSGRRVYEEAALQVSALDGADCILRPDGTQDDIPFADELAVLHIRPRSWKLVPVRCREENLRAFLAARDIWQWKKDTAPAVLGKAL